jgi:rhodanese-related sulfurtransferase
MQDLINFFSHHINLTTATVVIMALLAALEIWRKKNNTAQVTAVAVVQLINHQDAVVIDLRSAEEFSRGHIIAAQSMSHIELPALSKKLNKYKKRPIVLVCASGLESQKVTTHLQREGYTAYALANGMRSWIDAQLPVVKE